MNNIVVSNGGTISIGIVEDGMMAWADIPCPMMTEIQREEKVQKALNGLYLHGYFVEILGRRRNPVFDKKGEKSTTKIMFRPPKNEDEARFILDKIEKLLTERYGKV